MQLNETLVAAGQTSEVVADGNHLLLAVIAETATTISVQLELRIGASWVPIGAPLTAVGTLLQEVPDGTYRADFTGSVITSCQIGMAT